MKISVIIPTYNDRETLSATIRSVLATKYRYLEIIVINDGGESPKDFIGSLTSPVRLIDLKVNVGVSAARNLGFQEASGEIVHFLDADDLVAADTYQFVSDYFENLQVSMLALGQISVPHVDVEDSMGLLCAKPRSYDVETLDPWEFYVRFRSQRMAFLPSCVVFKRSAICRYLGNSPWEEDLRIAEDDFFFLRFGRHVGISQASDQFLIYRLREESASMSDPNLTIAARLTAMDRLSSVLEVENAPPKFIRLVKHLRQSSARRLAREIIADGEIRRSRQILIEDIKKSFNFKSLVELTRSLVGG